MQFLSKEKKTLDQSPPNEQIDVENDLQNKNEYITGCMACFKGLKKMFLLRDAGMDEEYEDLSCGPEKNALCAEYRVMTQYLNRIEINIYKILGLENSWFSQQIYEVQKWIAANPKTAIAMTGISAGVLAGAVGIPSRESTFCRAWAWVLCLQWASPQMLRWVLWAAWSLEACWSSFATWLCPVELIERLRRMLQERPGRFRAWWRLFVRCQAPSSHAKWSNWWLCMRAWSQPSLPTKTGSAIGALVKEVRSKYQWKWPLAAVSTSCAKLISKSGMNLLNAMAIWDAQCAEHSFRMFQVIFWFWDQEIQEAGVKESASVMEIFGIYSTYFRPRCTFFWGVSINGESPQMVGWFHGKSQSKMDDLGYPPMT